MLISFGGKKPRLASSVFIAPTAVIIGDVTLEENASVWFNAVVRGDMAPIVIGSGTNIQDNCTLHTDPGCPLTIGSYVTVGHNAVVHGCTIEDRVLVGMQSVIMNNAVIAHGSVVAAGSVIKEGQKIGPRQLAAGMPAQVKKELNESYLREIQRAADHYIDLIRYYS